MSVTPYLGLAELTGDKVGIAKGIAAEFVGTLFLVSAGHSNIAEQNAKLLFRSDTHHTNF